MAKGKKIIEQAKKDSRNVQAAILTFVVLGVGFGALIGLLYMTFQHFS